MRKRDHTRVLNFPGGTMDKNLPASGDMGSILGLGRSLPAAEQLSRGTSILKSTRPRAHAPQREKPPQWEACTQGN